MKTTTARDPNHPWNYHQIMKGKMKKILTAKSNEQLDSLVKQIAMSEGVPPKLSPKTDGRGCVIELTRPEKIAILMDRWDENYRMEFQDLHGFPLEDTKDPVKFKKHFRAFKRRTRWQIFVFELRLLWAALKSPFKRPRYWPGRFSIKGKPKQ